MWQKRLQRESGQMAIFVALIFQVLFIIFAMVINVGLVIHDKINLQNAVDIASYYGAQRQAEMLNEIAAINYQMRQEYKLLVFRQRVLGNFGRPAHPASSVAPATGDVADVKFEEADAPAVCVSHTSWRKSFKVSPEENICQNQGISIPEIPSVTLIAPFLPFNLAAERIVEQMRSSWQGKCEDIGPMNWFITSSFVLAFRNANGARKQTIEKLAENIASADMKDRNSASVEAGVRKTLMKNLTFANREYLEANPDKIKVFNSMSVAPCNQVPFWLPKININVASIYTDGISGGGCTPKNKPVSSVPNGASAYDPDGKIAGAVSAEPPDQVPNRSSIGFEKNPWCLVYYGVSAETQPRKPFSPFGSTVTLKARGFASPFGGRVGPWYRDQWAPNAPRSTGAPVDALIPPRAEPGAEGIQPAIGNYSRFPGDPLGLKSRRALAIARRYLKSTNGVGEDLKIDEEWLSDITNSAATGDSLAWDRKNNRMVPLRQVEAAAIAPDIFDILYYSIEPKFFKNYYVLNRQNPNRFGNLFLPISDVGARFNVPEFDGFGISEQIRFGAEQHIDRQLAYYIADSPDLTLTSWTQKSSSDYSFPDTFGTCRTPPAEDVPVPGNCVVGGRTGYSIRIVSRDFLLSDQHQLGGRSGSRAPLLNPPPPEF